MQLNKEDYGFYSQQIIPMNKRKSISFLLGAGFSIPQGYPSGDDLNKYITRMSDRFIYFTPAGELIEVEDEAALNRHSLNGYDLQYRLCLKLIEKCGNFKYEEFYDYLNSNEINTDENRMLVVEVMGNTFNLSSFRSLIPIYNQMVSFFIKDKAGKQWYEDVCHNEGEEKYISFLKYMQSISNEYLVNVHTLNHDLFFESFNKTDCLQGRITDGFDEYGSEYFGKLTLGCKNYNCRLERYTNYYDNKKPIRLYKLHGSLDYIIGFRTKGIMVIPDKIVKLKENIRIFDVFRTDGKKKRESDASFSYHANVLSGTISKISQYNNPIFYKKIFTKFKHNLRSAEKLVIIGYGAKDVGINRILKENFDYRNKKVYILDPSVNKNGELALLARELHAEIITKSVESINIDMLC